ncbi:protein FAM92A-A [Harmonia axyridis]|uniref:protein FAM92A-A n=1 Tax=Harmonia axyridis TaxID=115357 RepID=UPI001E27975E|nr:protein FAM92A-A [Harmonia axyridis]
MPDLKSKPSWEQETHLIQTRIISVEHRISELCSAFAQYSKKLAKIRDGGDELSTTLTKYTESEEISKSQCLELQNFSEAMQVLSDYGENRVTAIDHKVVGEFSKYGYICKQLKEEIKQIYNAKDRETSKKRQLDRIRERNPKNRQQIVQAETELIRATADLTKTVHLLEEKVIQFEKQKLHDIKEIFLDFIVTEIGYHSKALQILSKTYEGVSNIDEGSDLQSFKDYLLQPDPASGRGDQKSALLRVPSLSSLGTIFSVGHRRNTPGIPGARKLSRSEDNLDSMKADLSDTEDTHSDFNKSESLSEFVVKSTDDRIKRPH